VHSSILEDLRAQAFVDKVVDVKTLAYLIIDRCACNVFDPESITIPNMQFLRQFDKSIDDLVSSYGHALEVN
jgi:hypothetical protein